MKIASNYYFSARIVFFLFFFFNNLTVTLIYEISRELELCIMKFSFLKKLWPKNSTPRPLISLTSVLSRFKMINEHKR